jgi:predicted RNA binding protein YcfA (HicA-like mRNA interferase family)
MTYQDMTQYLRRHGWQFRRQCRGSHEQWTHPTGGLTTVTRSGLGDRRSRQNWIADLQRKELAA